MNIIPLLILSIIGTIIFGVSFITLLGYYAVEKRKANPTPQCSPSRGWVLTYHNVSRKAVREARWWERMREIYRVMELEEIRYIIKENKETKS